MRVFPTAGHLASWAGLCPGNNESAGTYRSTEIGSRGIPFLGSVPPAREPEMRKEP